MNWSNFLTLLRLVLTFFFVITINLGNEWQHAYWVALLLFLIAAITDWLDGFLARRWDMCTDLGKLLDPLADKVLISSALIALIPLGIFPAWSVILIIAREFLVTGLRLVAAEKGVILAADRFGKLKTLCQMATVLFYLFLLGAGIYLSLFSPFWHAAWGFVGPAMLWVTVLVTLFSGVGYFLRNWRVFLKDSLR